MESETKVKVKALPQCTRCQGSLVMDREHDLVTGLSRAVRNLIAQRNSTGAGCTGWSARRA